MIVNARPLRRESSVVLVAVAAFVASMVAVHVLNPGWRPWEVLVSYYVRAAGGWLVIAGLVALALASVVIGRMLSRLGIGGTASHVLWWIWALSVLVGAVFPADPPGNWDRPPSVAGMVHGIAGWLAFAAFSFAAIALTHAWQRDVRELPQRRALTGATVLVCAGLVGFVVTLVDVLDGPSLGAFGAPTLVGLAERVLLTGIVAWLAVVAVALRHVGTRESLVTRR